MTQVEDDWQYCATVIDRLLLFLFTAAYLVGSAYIILRAPTLSDYQEPIDVALSKLGSKIRPNMIESFEDDI